MFFTGRETQKQSYLPSALEQKILIFLRVFSNACHKLGRSLLHQKQAAPLQTQHGQYRLEQCLCACPALPKQRRHAQRLRRGRFYKRLGMAGHK